VDPLVHAEIATALSDDSSIDETASNASDGADVQAGATASVVDINGARPQGASVANGRRTSHWYNQRVLSPLYQGGQHPDCLTSVEEFASIMLGWKREHLLRNLFMDKLLRFLHERVLPQGNLLPPSIYLLQKVNR
jgi:hypothetical protein